MKAIVSPIRTFLDELHSLYPFLIPVFGVVLLLSSGIVVAGLFQGSPKGSVWMWIVGATFALYLHSRYQESKVCSTLYYAYLTLGLGYALGWLYNLSIH